MSRKYLIIMIAACVICLGAGAFIGAGLNQSNLSATGVSIGSLPSGNILGSEVDNIIAMQQETQKKIDMIKGAIAAKSDDIQDILAEIKKANTVLCDVSQAMSAEKSAYMTSGICSGCNETGVKLSWQPGDALKREDWIKVAESIKDRMDELQDKLTAANSDLQNIMQQHDNALKEMAELNKRLYDARMKERERSEKAG